MGLIRNGDPYGFPDIDAMIRRKLLLHLDTVWRHDYEARNRSTQLEQQGKTVYVIPRYAPPEEVKGHLPTRGIPEIGEREIHLDGRYTLVFDVWVVVKRLHRKKKKTVPKPKRKTPKKKK